VKKLTVLPFFTSQKMFFAEGQNVGVDQLEQSPAVYTSHISWFVLLTFCCFPTRISASGAIIKSLEG
jgi:hypothetical protein